MDDSSPDIDHPRVVFRKSGLLDIGWGYLSIINGVPWLAATLEEARSNVPATMIRLDPQLLEEQQDNETGERSFLYRGVLPVR